MKISPLPRGVKKVTLTAVDSHGNKATRQFDLTYDKKPEYDSLFDLNNDGVIDNTDVQYVADKVAASPLGR